MLVLTLTRGQTLAIGDTVIVYISTSQDGAIRLGIEADQSLTILREKHFTGQQLSVLKKVKPAVARILEREAKQ